MVIAIAIYDCNLNLGNMIYILRVLMEFLDYMRGLLAVDCIYLRASWPVKESYIHLSGIPPPEKSHVSTSEPCILCALTHTIQS